MIKVDKIPELRNNLQNKNFEKKKESKKDEHNGFRLKTYKEHNCMALKDHILEEFVLEKFNLRQLLDEIKQIELRLSALEEKLGKEDSIMKESTGDEKEVDIADLLESLAENVRVMEARLKAMES